MSIRTHTIVLALASMALPAAFAQSASVFVGGERGWIDLPVQSSLTRDQVTREYLAFRKSPVAPDGGRFVGGEMGYVFPQHTYARINGEWVCTDKIAHNPAPPAIKTPAERSAFLRQYPA
ncbi:MAG: DUF4148 domain-containing protein [Ramlibacter sp.]|nr:DUF4148 domain-containing protein [Ramlibacter sp.]